MATTTKTSTTLDLTKAEIAYLALYLGKAETRDKICRAIQYGSKFISDGQPGVAATVDKNTSLARKVFRLLKVAVSFITSLTCLLVGSFSCLYLGDKGIEWEGQVQCQYLKASKCEWCFLGQNTMSQKFSSQL
jgi:hypothetical protein